MNLHTRLDLDLTQTLYLFEVWPDGRTEYTPDFDPMFRRTFEEGPTVSTIIEDLQKQARGEPRYAFLTNSYEDLLKEVGERFPKDKDTLAVSREVFTLVCQSTGTVDFTNHEVHLVGTTDMPSRLERMFVLDRLPVVCDELDAKALCLHLYNTTDGRGILPEDVSEALYTPDVSAIRAELESE